MSHVIARCSTLQVSGLFYADIPRSAARQAPGGVPVFRSTPREAVYDVAGPVGLNEGWLADWLLAEADPAGTPYRGVSRLLPGQQAVVQASGWGVQEFAGPSAWPTEPDLDGEAAVRAITDAVDAAVAELSAGQSVIAASLSGGLDSTFVVSALARHAPADAELHLLTHVPDRNAVLDEGGWVASDESAAASLVAMYADRISSWELVVSDHSRAPLEFGREASLASWWPGFGVDNLAWIKPMGRRAQGLGAQALWVGTNGNAAFSYTPGPAPLGLGQRARRQAGRWKRRLRGSSRAPASPPVPNLIPGHRRNRVEVAPASFAVKRRDHLMWLAGQHSAFSGASNPDGFTIPQLDPFRDERVLEVAARVTDSGWRYAGVARGLAREAGRGRVPDQVRLRVARGAQGADVWLAVKDRRTQYLDAVEAACQTRIVEDVVDLAALRAMALAWPWGESSPPPRVEIILANRILTFAQFIRDTEDRLDAINAERGAPANPST